MKFTEYSSEAHQYPSPISVSPMCGTIVLDCNYALSQLFMVVSDDAALVLHPEGFTLHTSYKGLTSARWYIRCTGRTIVDVDSE